ncbi:hypothetical protein [Arthrobacter silvisoli]|uniref:hypothetical protein n=1 Tax=Arthrobacter silvisoli TaxID=2291022 RepID=UPI000E20CA31|nr:hypothetical protein [Arthrobacter silvisoli]
MPFDAAPATAHTDARTGPPAAMNPAEALPVIPCVDAAGGSVLLSAAGRQELRRCADPVLLTRLLSRSVRPALWFPAERKLLLAVAARGYRGGKELSFILD